MGTKHKLTVSVQPPTARPTTAQRRAAQIAALATEQADLKREAAERRRNAAPDRDVPAAPKPRRRSARRIGTR
jgi:hypothetical protein